MCEMWEDDNAGFLRKLVGQRARMFMRNREYLRSLRGDYEEAKQLQKRFGHVWAEYGTDIYKLTAEACGENWDFDCRSSQDEEKNAFAEEKKEAAVKQKNDDLAATRQAGSRRGLDQLQGISQESECVLEEEEGLLGGKSPQKESPQKEARQEEGSGGRRTDFYRRAGGTC
jgi:hypothetical protein